MKLTIQLQLLPAPEQASLLLDTMRRVNEAATFAAEIAFAAGVFSQPSVHKLAYAEIRARFNLSAQLTVRAIGKAVEAFASLKAKGEKSCPTFRPDGAITYDQRNLSFKGLDTVSLSTLQGRQRVGIIYGEYQAQRFDRIKGQCDLVYRKSDGKFYLYCTVDFQEEPLVEVKDFLGIDLGIVNLATDSTGEKYTGEKIDAHRKRHNKARKTYQRRNTRSARKRLRKLAGRQRRFQRDINHVISKKIVAKALARRQGIAMEDLTGIRVRCEQTVSKRQRQRFSNWAFFQLRCFVTYKAMMRGVVFVVVDPRNTSRTCFVCGYCDKGNRKTQDQFSCLACGYKVHADENAARNIGRLGAFCQPS